MTKFTSRKFLAFVGTLLVLVGGVLTGESSWPQILWPAVAALLGYLGVQGYVDARAANPR